MTDHHRKSQIKEIRNAIDVWASHSGLSKSPEHEQLASFIVDRCHDILKQKITKEVCLLADYDGKGGYKNGRIVEWTGPAEEMLYPIDPKTDEPVEESIADAMLTLVHPEALPEI